MNYSVHTYNAYNPKAPRTMIRMDLEEWLIMVWWVMRNEAGHQLARSDRKGMNVDASTAGIQHGYLLFVSGDVIEYTALA